MSLRTRLVAAFAYVLLLVLVALLVPLALNVSKRVDAEVAAQALGTAHLLAASASGQLEQTDEIEDVVESAAEDVQGRVVVVDREGRLVLDSAGEGLVGELYGDRPEIETVLRDGVVLQGERHSDTLGDDILYTTVPIVEAGERVGAVRVTQSVAAVERKVRRDIAALAGIGAVALLLGIGVAWLLAGSLSRPLRALSRSAERVAAGDLEERVEVAGSREQREVATAFNAMTERLGRSLAAQREFVANASHQLRTPLTGLRLRIEAAGTMADDPPLAQELEAAEREAERLSRLLADLLTLAREPSRAAPREPLPLADAVAEAVERWQGAAESGGHTLVISELAAATALTSAEDVAIMLDNLIENALSYSPSGAVTIEVGTRGGAAFFAVLDEGPGLAQDEAERVFERFARGTAGSSAPGTGLGLAIVRALAERWDGTATLANREPSGARAEVTLPLAALPTPKPELTRALPAVP